MTEKDPLQSLKDLLTDPKAPRDKTFIKDVNYAIKLVEDHREKEAELLLKSSQTK